MQYIRLSTSSLKRHFHWDFTQEERCTWYELLLVSRESPFPGYLQQSLEKGYPTSWLAAQIGIPTSKMQKHLQKFIDDGSLEINSQGCIKISNWEKYQPKYNKYEENDSSQAKKDNAE